MGATNRDPDARREIPIGEAPTQTRRLFRLSISVQRQIETCRSIAKRPAQQPAKSCDFWLRGVITYGSQHRPCVSFHRQRSHSRIRSTNCVRRIDGRIEGGSQSSDVFTETQRGGSVAGRDEQVFPAAESRTQTSIAKTNGKSGVEAMPFIVPTFPISANIWHNFVTSINVYASPDVHVVCNLAPGRRVPAYFVEGLGTGTNPTRLNVFVLFPALTDVRPANGTDAPDIIEVPSGSGLFYQLNSVCDMGKGFANEHRVAAVTMITDKVTFFDTAFAFPVPIP